MKSSQFKFTFTHLCCVMTTLALSMGSLGTAFAQQKNPPPGKQKNEQAKFMREKTFPVNASWTAVSYNNKTYSGDRPTMILDGQSRMQGFSGCNTYSATSYAMRGQRLAVGPLAFTKRACSSAQLASERAFLVALRGSYQWDLKGSYLIIKSSEGELRFERTL